MKLFDLDLSILKETFILPVGCSDGNKTLYTWIADMLCYLEPLFDDKIEYTQAREFIKSDKQGFIDYCLKTITDKEKEHIDMTLYHVSQDYLTEFSQYPSWFMTDKVFGQYLFDQDKENNKLYEVFADCNILTNEEIMWHCVENAIDFYAIEEKLADNPTILERKRLVEPLLEFCDGFMQFDFDPRDESENIESVIIFNPNKHIVINDIIR